MIVGRPGGGFSRRRDWVHEKGRHVCKEALPFLPTVKCSGLSMLKSHPPPKDSSEAPKGQREVMMQVAFRSGPHTVVVYDRNVPEPCYNYDDPLAFAIGEWEPDRRDLHCSDSCSGDKDDSDEEEDEEEEASHDHSYYGVLRAFLVRLL